MSTVTLDLQATLKELDPDSASKLERLVRDAIALAQPSKAKPVEVDAKGALRVIAVDMAVDCGPQVNTERIRSQLEGAVIMGLGLTKYGEITFKDGKVVQNNFNDHAMLRHNEAPRDIRVHFAPADYSVAPGGVGEPGLPPIAPALCNAIFAATGKRIRRLPIGEQLTVA